MWALIVSFLWLPFSIRTTTRAGLDVRVTWRCTCMWSILNLGTPNGSRQWIRNIFFTFVKNLGSLSDRKQNILQGWPYHINSSQNIYLQMLHFELILSAWTQPRENTLQVWLDHYHTSPKKSWSELWWIQKFKLDFPINHIHLVICKLYWTNNTLLE